MSNFDHKFTWENYHNVLPRCLNLMQTAEWSIEWLWESKEPGDVAHSTNDQVLSDSTISASLNGSLQNLPFGWSDVHLQHLSANAKSQIMDLFMSFYDKLQNCTCALHMIKLQLFHILLWNMIISSAITVETLRRPQIIFACILRFLTILNTIQSHIFYHPHKINWAQTNLNATT